MREVTASAPGKVNLTLHVGAPDTDGYHPLHTVFEALDLRETVTVRTRRAPGIDVKTTAYRPDGAIDEQATAEINALAASQHLAVKAAKALQKLAMATPWAHNAAGLQITVEKRVPIAGGMAGGSADAAATLVACNEIWQLGLTTDQLQAVGRQLGADVPACIVGGISLGQGRGDRMEMISEESQVKPRHLWVLALSDFGLSTPEVFRSFDDALADTELLPLPTSKASELAYFMGHAREIAPHLHNDLEETAVGLKPEIAETLRVARNAGALVALLSGSGPTVAALIGDADDPEASEVCHAVAAALKALPHIRAVVTARGPVDGARIEESRES